MVYDLLNSSSVYNNLLQYYEHQGNNIIFNIILFVCQRIQSILKIFIIRKIIYRVRQVSSLETWLGRTK